jgi:peptidoglycan hydrolase-like protein with peptidoglycan-binding domain
MAKMLKQKNAKKMLPMIIIALFLTYTPLWKPINAVASDVRSKQSHKERTQYHLIKVVQRKLIEKGYEPGPVDGINGPLTQEAIKDFQREQGLEDDGVPGPETLKRLGL